MFKKYIKVMKHFKTLAVILLTLSICLQYSSKADEFQSATPESQGVEFDAVNKLGQIVEDYFNDGSIMGGELLIIKNDKTVFHQAYGWRDKDDNDSMAINTIFNIRSMTKPITGTAVQILIDEGKIKAGDKVSKYISGFDNDKSRDITIKQLLTHTSGLPLSILFDTASLNKYHDLITLANATGEQGPQFEPGSKFWYSDAGTEVLGAIVEVVSGKKLDVYVQEKIFKPLNMNDSYYLNKQNMNMDRKEFASLYAGSQGGWKKILDAEDEPIYNFPMGSQSIFMSLMDYAKFLRLYLDGGVIDNKTIISQDAVKRVLTPVSYMKTLGSDAKMPTTFPNTELYYGQMMIIYAHETVPEKVTKPFIISHSGSDGTFAWAFPEEDLMILYFTQSRGQATGIQMEKDIYKLLINPDYKEEISETPKQLKKYLGDYMPDHNPSGERIFTILFQNDGLAIITPGQMALDLDQPDKDGWRPIKLAPAASINFDEEDGKVKKMRLKQIGTFPKSDSIVSIEGVPDEIAPYIGNYTIPAVNMKFSVFWEDGLKIKAPQGQIVVLDNPDEKGMCFEKDNPSKVYEFEKDETGKVIKLKSTDIFSFTKGFPLSLILEEEIRSNGIENYREFFEEFRTIEEYILTEKSMNYLGYRFIKEEKFAEAFEIFKLNTELYPDSFNVWDSLGEGYMLLGNNEMAIENFSKSLELNPDNKNATNMIQEIIKNMK